MEKYKHWKFKMNSDNQLKNKIFDLVKEYYQENHQKKSFVPGKSRVQYSGRVFNEQELIHLVDSSLDFWLTSGPYSNQFENKMKSFFNSNDFLLVNSGSSANLLMVSTLCSPELNSRRLEDGYHPMQDGDEVITPSVTFPTTLAPILQNRLVPVFVDCELGTYNIDANQVESAISSKTKALFIPHTVGNPFDLTKLLQIAEKHKLWLLEDGCDALGATFDGKLVGTFGHMSSLSFYPAHHITMGEGGGVVVNHPMLKKTALSIRDWGRDCWCEPGKSDTCGKRFKWKCGELPEGYDHKYIYSNVGYNLKVTDMQAAVGVAQFEKIHQFIEARRRNFKRMLHGLKSLEEHLILPIVDPRANPSPFGFPVTVKNPELRSALIKHLEGANIETRLVFGGHILKQPGYLNIPRRIHGSLKNSEIIMNQTLFTGVYPGLNDSMIDYVVEQYHLFFNNI